MKYYFYRNPFFKVYATVEDGHVRMHTSGVASKPLKPVVSSFFDLFEGSKFAKILDNQLIFSTWMPPIPSKAFDRLVKSQMGSMRGKLVPEQVTISITEDCPNKCLHCALPDTKNKASLSPDAIKSAIDQCLDLGSTFIVFDGGEPLLYEGLEELISYVDREKAITGMFTSGVGFTPEKAQSLKAAGLDMLSVSLDSANEKGHDSMRGRSGVFNDAMNAIRYSLDAGLLVNIYVVLSPLNIHELEDFYNLATEMGVHEISFFEIVPTGRWIDHEKDVLSKQDLKRFDDFVEWANQREGPRVFPIPHVLRKLGCFAGRKWIHITPQGDVNPCACMPMIVGNIHQENISDIWKKLRSNPEFNAGSCLMRDDEFRDKYILNKIE
ncbi:MoaA/NifB/PqqE/SkfB family radical SAM enzyme [Methanohalophilus levihalophilus]|uniref:radical SAM/SPASM domain-containing protein n=1 Tax=Methanohalophilus levihalophilus TaxID=1431282 RepID=UPI001AE8ED25|nr:radical SAM protein [Methanohalophilus levihalophilus]MBP2031331.1 MoaA/NifB/PqqE/SkfB family radical SAM enzyme [Methanohalophilus levihalophilus]